jgi:hypothetical protein
MVEIPEGGIEVNEEGDAVCDLVLVARDGVTRCGRGCYNGVYGGSGLEDAMTAGGDCGVGLAALDEGEVLDAEKEVDEFFADHAEFCGAEADGIEVVFVGEGAGWVVFKGEAEAFAVVAGCSVVIAVCHHGKTGAVLDCGWSAAFADHSHCCTHVKPAVSFAIDARAEIVKDRLY